MTTALRDKLRALTRDPAAVILLAAAGLIAVSVFKDVALLAVGRDRELSNLLGFLSFHSGTDSWMPMYRAVELFRSDRAADIYQTVFFDQHTKFQYPPTSLLPFAALSSLGVGRDAGTALMQLLSWAGVIGIIAATARIMLAQRALPGLKPLLDRPGAAWLVTAAVAAGTLTFDPIMYAYEVGQIQILIDLAVGASLLSWLKKRRGVSGALMALATLIKPQYGLVLVWSLLRRKHDFTKGFLVVGVPAGLLSLLVFGLGQHLSYLSVLSYISHRGELFWANQSVNGLLNRLFVDADAMTWSASDFAPYTPIVYAGTLASTLAFMLAGLGFRPRWARSAAARATEAGAQESLLDLATMVVGLTLASPIAWEHHYGVTWPIMAVALVALADLRAHRPGRLVDGLLVGLGASYLLTSNYLTQLFPVAGTPLDVLQSYYLFGGIILFGVLLSARAALDPNAAAPGRTGRAAKA